MHKERENCEKSAQKPNVKVHLILYCCLLLALLSNPLESKKTRLLKLLIFLSTTNSFHQIIEKEPQNKDIIFVEKSK